MELPQVPPIRCIHLHSTSMAIHGEGFTADPDSESGMRDCWCIKTARPLGPDNRLVGLKPCSDPDRDCYEEY